MKRGLLFAFSIVFALVCSELVLRLLGHKSGTFRQLDGFSIVDSLIVYRDFVTDEAGIYKHGTWVTDSAILYFDCKEGRLNNAGLEANLYDDYVLYQLHNFCRITDKQAANNFYWKAVRFFKGEPTTVGKWEFEKAVESILAIPEQERDEWMHAVAEYVHKPFNKDGFRGIDFKPYHGKRKKILLLGDSFTYGMSARPFYNCFADILLARGYMVYNTGIPATDPAQYAAVAQKYIPLLKPDVVVVCFYEGNDHMLYNRIPAAGYPPEYCTNAGVLSSNPYGVFLTAEQAYRYCVSTIKIPEGGLFNSVCAATAIGGLIWNAAFNAGLVAGPGNINNIPEYNPQHTLQWIRKIDSTVAAHGSAYLKVVIPYVKNNRNGKGFLDIQDRTHALFKGQPYYYPLNLSAENDYGSTDIHFNNAGSLKFANYLDSLIPQITPNR